jgi:2-keto-3-deoxy-galactonokinase
MYQLSSKGLKCQLAAAAAAQAKEGLGNQGFEFNQGALMADLEGLLTRMACDAKQAGDLGRVVICLRVGSQVGLSEPGLVVAAAGSTGLAAAAAVHGLVQQLSSVYD